MNIRSGLGSIREIDRRIGMRENVIPQEIFHVDERITRTGDWRVASNPQFMQIGGAVIRFIAVHLRHVTLLPNEIQD